MHLYAANKRPVAKKLTIPDSFKDIALTKRCIKDLVEAEIFTPSDALKASDEDLIACYGINADNLDAFKAKFSGVK
jgi:hypothetical protein